MLPSTLTSSTRVAIIGAGISGLSLAYLLDNHCQVTLYEAEQRLGGHTRTIQIIDKGYRLDVDTGFIVFNKRTYPHLTAFFKHLDVPIQPSCMSFSVSLNKGEREWGSPSPLSLFEGVQGLFSLSKWRRTIDIYHFNRTADQVIKDNPLLTLGQLVDHMGLGDWFKNCYIMPMAAAIWSSPLESIDQFPASSFIHFFKNHGLLTYFDQPQWYTVTGGSQNYIDKFKDRFKGHIRNQAAVMAVDVQSDGKIDVTDLTGHTEHFDHVVFACHGDQVLPLLKNPIGDQVTIYSKFKYEQNTVITHCDPSSMPRDKKCWASWNFISDAETKRSGVTYWMNELQALPQALPVFVTLNPTHNIDKSLVYDEVSFSHPLYNKTIIDAQCGVSTLQGQNNLWYCGAYLGYGFHEDGIKSAVTVANMLGVTQTWL